MSKEIEEAKKRKEVVELVLRRLGEQHSWLLSPQPVQTIIETLNSYTPVWPGEMQYIEELKALVKDQEQPLNLKEKIMEDLNKKIEEIRKLQLDMGLLEPQRADLINGLLANLNKAPKEVQFNKNKFMSIIYNSINPTAEKYKAELESWWPQQSTNPKEELRKKLEADLKHTKEKIKMQQRRDDEQREADAKKKQERQGKIIRKEFLELLLTSLKQLK